MTQGKIEFILAPGTPELKYETAGASGLDVTAQSIKKMYIYGDGEIKKEVVEWNNEDFKENGFTILEANVRYLIGTGITVAYMDKNLEIQVRSRSGHVLKKGLAVQNQPGTVDSDYRGEIGIIVTPVVNTEIKLGERIAQLVFAEVCKPEIQYTLNISESDRGEGGFGSTN